MDGTAKIGLEVTEDFGEVEVVVKAGTEILERRRQAVTVAHPLLFSAHPPISANQTEISVRVLDSAGVEVISYSPAAAVPAATPIVATEPAAPGAMSSVEEFYLAGLHFAQYRHATRRPQLYWREALRRDLGDSRSNIAMAAWHMRRASSTRPRPMPKQLWKG